MMTPTPKEELERVKAIHEIMDCWANYVTVNECLADENWSLGGARATAAEIREWPKAKAAMIESLSSDGDFGNRDMVAWCGGWVIPNDHGGYFAKGSEFAQAIARGWVMYREMLPAEAAPSEPNNTMDSSRYQGNDLDQERDFEERTHSRLENAAARARNLIALELEREPVAPTLRHPLEHWSGRRAGRRVR